MATISLVSLFRMSLATPKFPDPSSLTTSYLSISTSRAAPPNRWIEESGRTMHLPGKFRQSLTGNRRDLSNPNADLPDEYEAGDPDPFEQPRSPPLVLLRLYLLFQLFFPPCSSLQQLYRIPGCIIYPNVADLGSTKLALVPAPPRPPPGDAEAPRYLPMRWPNEEREEEEDDGGEKESKWLRDILHREGDCLPSYFRKIPKLPPNFLIPFGLRTIRSRFSVIIPKFSLSYTYTLLEKYVAEGEGGKRARPGDSSSPDRVCPDRGHGLWAIKRAILS